MSRLLCLTELPRRGPSRQRDCRSPLTESNRRPSPYHGDALPTELRGRRTYACADRSAYTNPPHRPTVAVAPDAGFAHSRETLATWGRRVSAGADSVPVNGSLPMAVITESITLQAAGRPLGQVEAVDLEASELDDP